MKKILALFALLFLLIVSIPFIQNYAKNRTLPFISGKSATVTIKEQTFNITVADDQKKKEQGLAEKDSLEENEGMLFPFDKDDYYFFWMKKVKFPLDIIYINDNKIVTIIKNAEPQDASVASPPVYKSEEPADTVLEIKGGLSDKYNFQIGDEIKIEGL